ncbi:MAG: cytochrome c oxidase assembly protein subunit 15 [Porticoccaceae bacterium]|jgi:cytochrome c oxidase assembly protein subunit 15|tara:strand:- start:687 stop:1742 length:1056 start_codon:yes stop_codon:yes gene_type:complete
MAKTIQSPNPQGQHDRQIAYWLFFCAAVIFGMILLGGVTRLTSSGLSMVDWKPIMGVIPPMTQADWQEMFLKYQQFPEYQKINVGMSLEDFKPIFMYEYLHRVLGRLIGVIFIVPFLFFYFSRRIKTGLTPKLVIMLVGGGCQGLLGWYMVKSGLVDNPHVSQYRLTAHLGAAVLIYGFILWTAFGLVLTARAQPVELQRFSIGLSALIYLMILSGGLVAGTHAGNAYSTWPLMGDSFVPAGLYAMTPAWLSAFEDITTIQFNHRMFAYLIVALVVAFAIRAFRFGVVGRLKVGIFCLIGLLGMQVTLGISTLIFYVPIPVAAAHQVGAVALLTASLFISHCLSNGLRHSN